MPTKDFREFTFANETAARNAAASIAVPENFDNGRTVGKRMVASAGSIKPTAAMVSAQRRFVENGQTVIGWVVNVEADDAEKRDLLAPLAVSEREIPTTPPIPEVPPEPVETPLSKRGVQKP